MKKGSYKILKGDATNPKKKSEKDIAVIPHVCNNINSWGDGFVVALSNKWDNPEREYHLFVNAHSQNGVPKNMILGKLGQTFTGAFVKAEPLIYVANMIAQNGVRGKDNDLPLSYYALVKCMEEVRDNILLMKDAVKQEYLAKRKKDKDFKIRKVEIHAPLFGSGLAGGKWDIIEKLIKEIWVDSGIDVNIYKFDKD